MEKVNEDSLLLLLYVVVWWEYSREELLLVMLTGILTTWADVMNCVLSLKII